MSSPDGAVTVHGAEALRLATVLLQRMRQTRPACTVWEAADVQWWSRQERPTDRDGQLFWLDERGEPVAAVLATDFGHSVQHDVLIMTKDRLGIRLAWRTAIARASQTRGAGHEFPVHPADTTGAAELTAAGYQPSPGPGVISSWLDAADRPAVPPLASGYRLLSRADDPGRHYPPLRSAEPGPLTQDQRDQLTLTPGQQTQETAQWITELAAQHHVFAEQLADRQSLTLPAEDPSYGDLGQAFVGRQTCIWVVG